jgi:uroporphyrinogen decarboxylase
MRQAGRFLPEYRELRKTAKNFLDFCYNPDLATEVTLQPIRRFGLDASIVFADILVIPDALGQKVEFKEGIGPVLEPITSLDEIERLSPEGLHEHMAPIYETIRRLSRELPQEVTLIGFAGAPWTVATYMVGGRGSPNQEAARLLAYREPETFAKLTQTLVDSTSDYLIEQVRAGAEVLQIFDTWAGSLAPAEFDRWCLTPIQTIVSKVREVYPDIPIIGFPKGVGPLTVKFFQESGVQAIGIDTAMDMNWVREHLSPLGPVQGNLDPLLVVAGGAEMERQARGLVELFSDVPYIFNTGHGIVPQTPPEHVEQLVRLVQNR